MNQYNKTYVSSKKLQQAQANYLANVKQIQTLNNIASSQSNKLPKSLLAVNQFADWSLPQYNKLLTFKTTSAPQYTALLTAYNEAKATNSTPTPVTPPSVTNINWVSSGVAWPTVYDQESCGGGYAFASVGALQGAYYQQSQVSLHLSVQ